MRTGVVGTAGHVDHGKTALVHALTGVSTDRLPDEKRRGISIELGFAPLTLDGGLRASIIDAPGHRRFVSTMIAGASGIDLVLLVVAADEGVMPQTREHLAVCELLGLDRGVVALTKVDRVDDETRALAVDEVEAAIAGRLHAAIVPCAPPSGVGMDALRGAMTSALAARLQARDTSKSSSPRLWVDRVLRVRGAGTVVTGTLVEGRVARGDRLALATARGPRPLTVRELHVHGERVEAASASTRLAINVTLDAGEVARGDLVTRESEAALPTSSIDASFRGPPVRRGARVTVHVGTASAAAEITRVEPLGDGEQLLRLVLERPLPVSGGDRHLVRGSEVTATSGALLGGGFVLDARPSPRDRARSRRALAAAVHSREPRLVLDALLAERAPWPLDVTTLSLALPLDSAVDAAVERGELVRCGSGVVPRATIAELAERARALVREHVAAAPLDRGMPLASLRSELARQAGPDAAEVAIRAARAQRSPGDLEAIAVEGDVALPAARTARLPRELRERLERANALLRDVSFHGLSSGRLEEVLGLAAPAARALLASLEREGAAVRAGDLWFSRDVVERVRAQIVAHLAAGGSLTVAAAKELCALPRRQAIVLLEHLDAAGVTRRVGETRVLCESASP